MGASPVSWRVVRRDPDEYLFFVSGALCTANTIDVIADIDTIAELNGFVTDGRQILTAIRPREQRVRRARKADLQGLGRHP
ncbi:hypothetical protein [Streptomyces sp. NPDC059411]|uniref:hypothetical protein n=1 Tax=Streptomyces sp. NPDC059411 TaxID=3346825 RepID=UPI0036CC6E29